MYLQYKSFENIVGKIRNRIIIKGQFLLFSVFSIRLRELSAIFLKFEIVVCKLFQFWRF